MISMGRIISWVVGKECFLSSVCSLDKTLLGFALLPVVPQGQTCLLHKVSLPTFAFQYPMMKGHFCVCVLVLEGLVGLHRTGQLQLFSASVVGA